MFEQPAKPFLGDMLGVIDSEPSQPSKVKVVNLVVVRGVFLLLWHVFVFFFLQLNKLTNPIGPQNVGLGWFGSFRRKKL